MPDDEKSPAPRPQPVRPGRIDPELLARLTRRVVPTPRIVDAETVRRIARERPEPRRPQRPERRVPRAAPFLVVRATADDEGVRTPPLPAGVSVASASVQALRLDPKTGVPAAEPSETLRAGDSYLLRCLVANLGRAPAFMGMAEFHVRKAAELNQLAKAPTTVPPHGYNGFVVRPGETVAVDCTRPFKAPAVTDELSLLVHVYDPLIDPIQTRFNAAGDRHVGRRDLRLDFSGTWMGFEATLVGKERGVTFKITQSGAELTAVIQYDGAKSSFTAKGKVVSGKANLQFTGSLGIPGFTDPSTKSEWVLTRAAPTVLGLTHVIQGKGDTPGSLLRQG
ncbi:MAG TPA: hypothetical protein VF746_10070 [Longimicrobium sp.]